MSLGNDSVFCHMISPLRINIGFFQVAAVGLFSFLLSSTQAIGQGEGQASPNAYVIPEPGNFELKEGREVFIWELTSIVALPEEPGRNAMKLYSSWLQSRDWPEELLDNFGPASTITGEEDPDILGSESYKLDIGRNGAVIRASHSAGFYYGMQTLLQLIEEHIDGNRAVIPAAVIVDGPSFEWRGMHLDVCRHFFPLDSVKKYIDWMARYKLNTFHWHLTEDQGWRIEIPDYPLLQEVAAWRDETLIGHYSEQPHRFDGKRYGGYYTQEEVRELVAYAAEHEITVVPEIEMPGHARAALAAYPELSCTGDSLPVATKWGVFDHVFCTKEETFDFLFSVLEDVIELFPGEYIHIGGDECPKDKWRECQTCQANIEKYGLKDEHELQSWFIRRIDTFLTLRGKKLIGWDEILEGGLSENAAVMSWRGTTGAVEAAKAGHPVVLCPTSHAYFDYYQSEDPSEPLAIGGYLPLDKVYALQPVPEELNRSGAEWVLGAQGNVWTEYIPTYDQVEYMAFPRMLAIAEVTWSGKDRPDFQDFARRVVHHFPEMDARGVDHGTQILKPVVRVEAQEGRLFFHAEKFMDDGDIIYSVKRGRKFGKTRVYKKPVRIKRPVVIQYCIRQADGLEGPVNEIMIDPGLESKSNITGTSPAPAYNGMGFQTLINGVAPPTLKHGGNEWLGWWKVKPEVNLSWDRKVKVEHIGLQLYRSEGSWIYLPEKIRIEINGDMYKGDIKVSKGEGNTWWYSVGLPKSKKVESLKIKFFPVDPIPSGAQGSGHPAWIFAGQVQIR